MRRRVSIPAIACWLALAASLSAQQYIFRAYRQPEGLANLALNALATDRKGFLWLATENGVYRFLGSEFVRFGPEQGIAEVNIQAILLDQNDTVWAGTSQNLYRYDGQRFVPACNTPIHISVWNSLAVEDAHHLLIVEKRRLYRLEFNDQNQVLSYRAVFPATLVKSIPDLSHIVSVTAVNNPQEGVEVWIGAGKELYSFSVSSPVSRQKTPVGAFVTSGLHEWNQARGLAEDSWAGVLLDRSGTLWAGGRSHVAALPHLSNRFVDHSIPGSYSGNIYPHAPLLEDREGRILAPTEDGIARWDGARWRSIDRASGLDITGHVVGMAFDAAGDPWLAIRGDGIFQWAGYEDWEGWNNPQTLPSAVIWAVVPSRGNRIYIGTDKGPGWIDPQTGASGRLFKSPRWTFGQVDTMGVNRDGTLWGGTFSGAVLRIDPDAKQTQQPGKLPSFITRTVADASGRVFYTTDNGIYVRDAANSRALPRRVPGADRLLTPSTQVDTGCLAPNGDLWFLTNNHLIRFAGGQWSSPPADGMPALNGSMLDISCAPDGAVWITGQQTGTWRLTLGGDRLEAWPLAPPRGLESLTPVAIVVDRRGWVWLGTDDGLLVWNGRIWRHLTQETGLTWNDVNQGVLLAASDGSMWIGTSGGMAHLLHPEHVFDSVPLGVMITNIRRGDRVFSPTQPIRLPWSALPLNFHIASPDMRNRSELVFRYRMDGLQPDWIESHDGNATFSALPPGEYTFMAMATNPGLSSWSTVLRVEVKILPPWWRSNWFFALCALALLFLAIAGDQLRAQRILQTRKHLEKLVRERTAELEKSRELLRIQATHDGLTGMLNRVAILRALAAEMDRARREDTSLVVALVDLDHFKRINDAYGHLAGDDALCWFAAAVDAAQRSYDHAGRYGGEEFLLVLPEVPIEAVEQRLRTLHASISNLTVKTHEAAFTFTCSIGATVFEPCQNSATVEILLAVADKALYAAKAAGRNRCVFRSLSDSVPQPRSSPRIPGLIPQSPRPGASVLNSSGLHSSLPNSSVLNATVKDDLIPR